MRLRIRYFFCFFLFFLSLNALDLKISAEALLLMDKDSGRVLLEKNAHRHSFPASMTKLGSALYILENHPKILKEKIFVSSEPLMMTTEQEKVKSNFSLPAWWLEDDGVSMHLQVGQKIPARDLFYGTMIGSGNDAINVLVYGIEKNIDQFINKMNQYLLKIGCKNTHFLNPSGLHHPQHFTTAYDLAIIMQRALKFPEIQRCFLTQNFFCSHILEKKFRQILQRNKLVISNHKLYYPKSLGGKTGYTKKAKFNLVSAAKHQDRTLILSYMGCPKQEQLFSEIKAIFEAFFKEKKIQKTFVPSYQIFLRKLKGAKNILKAELKKDLHFSYYPSEKYENFRVFIYWKRMKFPILKGEQVGELVLEESQQELVKLPIYAKERVEPTLFSRFMDWLKGDKDESTLPY